MTVATSLLTRPPPRSPADQVRLRSPAWVRHCPAVGPRLLAARRVGVRVVRLRLLAPAGAEVDPRGREGLASMAAPLLRAGTLRRDARRLAEVAEALGSDLVTGADWETGSLTIDVLRDDLEPGLDLLFDVARSPAFPASVVDVSRRQRIAQLRRRRNQPDLLGTDLLARALFGRTRYGASLLGSEYGLHRLERDHLVAFHCSNYALSDLSLIAAGDLEPERLLRCLEALTGGDESGPAVAPFGPPPDASSAPSWWPGCAVLVVDRPRSTTVELQVGHRGVARADPDLPALQLLNTVLGASPCSRLVRELRQRRGVCYFAHSRFVARRQPGPFFVTTSVGPEHARIAVQAILDAMRRLQDEEVPETELQTARRALETTVRRSFETNADLVDRLSHLEAFGLDDDAYAHGLREIETVGAERLRSLARRHLRPDRAVVVAVGPARLLRRALAPLGAMIETLPSALENFEGPEIDPRSTPQGAVNRDSETTDERR